MCSALPVSPGRWKGPDLGVNLGCDTYTCVMGNCCESQFPDV